MKYAPQFVIYSAITNYLSERQLFCLNAELSLTSIEEKQGNSIHKILQKHFDIELLRLKPAIWQDLWLYFYLSSKKPNLLSNQKWIEMYEKEVLMKKKITFGAVYDSYILLGIVKRQ